MRRGVAERSDVVGEGLAGKVAVDGSEFVQLDVDRTRLPDLDHLSELFVANKRLIHFEDGLLEDKELGVSQNLFGV